MERSSINSQKLNEKGVKKLDLNSIKSLNYEISQTPNLSANKKDRPVHLNMNSKNVDLKNDKESFLEQLLTKDYEKYMEFVAQEDFFCDKLVNLQNPYFYLPLNQKQNYGHTHENFTSYSKDKENFINKLSNKFAESPRKGMTQSNSYKHEKGKRF